MGKKVFYKITVVGDINKYVNIIRKYISLYIFLYNLLF